MINANDAYERTTNLISNTIAKELSRGKREDE